MGIFTDIFSTIKRGTSFDRPIIQKDLLKKELTTSNKPINYSAANIVPPTKYSLGVGQEFEQNFKQYTPSPQYKEQIDALGLYPQVPANFNSLSPAQKQAELTRLKISRAKYEEAANQIYNKDQTDQKLIKRRTAGVLGITPEEKEELNLSQQALSNYQQALTSFAMGAGPDPGEYQEYVQNSKPNPETGLSENDNRAQFYNKLKDNNYLISQRDLYLGQMILANYNDNYEAYQKNKEEVEKLENDEFFPKSALYNYDREFTPHSEDQDDYKQEQIEQFVDHAFTLDDARQVHDFEYIEDKVGYVSYMLKNKYGLQTNLDKKNAEDDSNKKSLLSSINNYVNGELDYLSQFTDLNPVKWAQVAGWYGVKLATSLGVSGAYTLKSFYNEYLGNDKDLDVNDQQVALLANDFMESQTADFLDNNFTLEDEEVEGAAERNQERLAHKQEVVEFMKSYLKSVNSTYYRLSSNQESNKNLQYDFTMAQSALDYLLQTGGDIINGVTFDVFKNTIKRGDDVEKQFLQNLSDSDYLQLYANLNIDNAYLGEQAAVTKLNGAVNDYLAAKKENLSASEKAYYYASKGIQSFESSAMSDFYAAAALLNEAPRALYDATIGKFIPLDDSENYSMWANNALLQKAYDIQQAGTTNEKKLAAWKDMPEELRDSFSRIAYKTEDQDDFFNGDYIGTVTDLFGQYGFTAGTMLLSGGGSTLVKWGLKPIQSASKKYFYRKALAEAITKKAIGVEVGAATGAAERTLAQNIMFNIKQGAKEIYSKSAFRKGLMQDAEKLSFQAKKLAVKKAKDRALAFTASSSQKAQIGMGALMGTVEGAIEAKSTYEESLRTYKQMADDYYANNYKYKKDDIQVSEEEILEAIQNHPNYEQYETLQLQIDALKDPYQRAYAQQQFNAQLQEFRNQIVEGIKETKWQNNKLDDALYQNMMLDADQAAASAANTNFFLNSMINGAIAVTLKQSILSKETRRALNKKKKIISDAISFTANPNSKVGFTAVVEDLTKKNFKNLAKRGIGIAKEASKTGAGEFLEEYSQNLSNQASQSISSTVYGDYLRHMFNENTGEILYNNFNSFMNQNFSTIDSAYSKLNYGIESVSQNAFNKDAIKEGVYGALSSLLGGVSFKIGKQFKTLGSLFKKDTYRSFKEQSGLEKTRSIMKGAFDLFSPITIRSGIIDAYTQSSDNLHLAEVAAKQINSIINESEVSGLYSWINSTTSIQNAYDEAVENGNELEANNLKLLKQVQNAIVLNLLEDFVSRNTSNTDSDKDNKFTAAQVFLNKIHELANLTNISDEDFDANGNFVYNRSIAQPIRSATDTNAQWQQKMQEYKEALDHRQEVKALRQIANEFGMDDSAMQNSLSDKQKLEIVSKNAQDMLAFQQKVREQGSIYDDLFGEQLSPESKAALIAGDLLYEDQIDRLSNIKDNIKEFKDSITKPENPLISKDADLVEILATYGNTHTITVRANAIDKEIQEQEAKLLSLDKEKDKKKAKDQKKQVKEQIKSLKAEQNALNNALAYIQDSKESFKLTEEDLVLTDYDIVNASERAQMALLQRESKNPSDELTLFINKAQEFLEQKDVANKLFPGAYLYQLHMQNRLEASTNEILNTRSKAIKDPSSIELEGAYVRYKMQRSLLKRRLEKYLDSSNYSNYAQWTQAIAKEYNSLDRQAAEWFRKELLKNPEYRNYVANVRLYGTKIAINKNNLEGVSPTNWNLLRMRALVAAILSEKKYAQNAPKILNVLSEGGKLSLANRQLLEDALRNKEYLKYVQWEGQSVQEQLTDEEVQATNELIANDSEKAFQLSKDQVSEIIDLLSLLLHKIQEAKETADNITTPQPIAVQQENGRTIISAGNSNTGPTVQEQPQIITGDLAIKLLNPSDIGHISTDVLNVLEQNHHWSQFLSTATNYSLNNGVQQDKYKLILIRKNIGSKCCVLAVVKSTEGTIDVAIGGQVSKYQVVGLVSEQQYDNTLGSNAHPLFTANAQSRSQEVVTYTVQSIKHQSNQRNANAATSETVSPVDTADQAAKETERKSLLNKIYNFISQLTYDGDNNRLKILETIVVAKQKMSQLTWQGKPLLQWIKDNLNTQGVLDKASINYHPILSGFVNVINGSLYTGNDLNNQPKTTLWGRLTASKNAFENANDENIKANIFIKALFSSLLQQDYERDNNFNPTTLVHVPHGLVIEDFSADATNKVIKFTLKGRGKTQSFTINAENYQDTMLSILETLVTDYDLQLDIPKPKDIADTARRESPTLRTKVAGTGLNLTSKLQGLVSLGVFTTQNLENIHSAAEIIIRTSNLDVQMKQPTVISNPVAVGPNGTVDVATGQQVHGQEVTTEEVAKQIQQQNIRNARILVDQMQTNAATPTLLNEDPNAEVYQSENNNNPVQYQRVTHAITKALGFEIDEYDPNNPYNTKAITLGNTIDAVVREFFDLISETTEYKDQLTSPYIEITEETIQKYVNNITKRLGVDTIPNLSQNGQRELITKLLELQNEFSQKEWFVVPKDITAFGQLRDKNGSFVNTAGTLDLLVYDSSSKFRIIDIKTLHFSSIHYANQASFASKEQSNNHKAKWTAQVNAYRQLLLQQYNIPFASDCLFILPIGVEYSPDLIQGNQKIRYAETEAVEGNDKLKQLVDHYTQTINGVETEQTEEIKTTIKFRSNESAALIISMPVSEELVVDMNLAETDATRSQGVQNPGMVIPSTLDARNISIAINESNEPSTSPIVTEAPETSNIEPTSVSSENSNIVDIENDDLNDDLLLLNDQQKIVEEQAKQFSKPVRFLISNFRHVLKKNDDSNAAKISKNRFIFNAVNKIISEFLLGANSTIKVTDLIPNLREFITNSKITTTNLIRGLVQVYDNNIQNLTNHIQVIKFESAKNQLLYDIYNGDITDINIINERLQNLQLTIDDVPQLKAYLEGDAATQNQIVNEFVTQYGSKETIIETAQNEEAVETSKLQWYQNKRNFLNSSVANMLISNYINSVYEEVARTIDNFRLPNGNRLPYFTEAMTVNEVVNTDSNTDDLNTFFTEQGIDVNSEQQAHNLLSILSPNVNKTQKKLFNKIIKALKDTNIPVRFEQSNQPGYYGRTVDIIDNEKSTKAIVINLTNIESTNHLLRVLLHESVHAITSYLIAHDRSTAENITPSATLFITELDNLISEIKDYLETVEGINTDELYGLNSAEEFIAEFFSNGFFQTVLKRIPSITNQTKRSMLQQVFTAIANALGKFFGQRTMEERVKNELLKILTLSNLMPNKGATYYNDAAKNNFEEIHVAAETIGVFDNYAYDNLSPTVQTNLEILGIKKEDFNILDETTQKFLKDCCK